MIRLIFRAGGLGLAVCFTACSTHKEAFCDAKQEIGNQDQVIRSLSSRNDALTAENSVLRTRAETAELDRSGSRLSRPTYIEGQEQRRRPRGPAARAEAKAGAIDADVTLKGDPRGMKYEVAERLLFEPGKRQAAREREEGARGGREPAARRAREDHRRGPHGRPAASGPCEGVPAGQHGAVGRARPQRGRLPPDGREDRRLTACRTRARASTIRSRRTTPMPTGPVTAGSRSSSSGTSGQTRVNGGATAGNGRTGPAGSCACRRGVGALAAAAAASASCFARSRSNPSRVVDFRRALEAGMVPCPAARAIARRASRAASGSIASRSRSARTRVPRRDRALAAGRRRRRRATPGRGPGSLPVTCVTLGRRARLRRLARQAAADVAGMGVGGARAGRASIIPGATRFVETSRQHGRARPRRPTIVGTFFNGRSYLRRVRPRRERLGVDRDARPRGRSSRCVHPARGFVRSVGPRRDGAPPVAGRRETDEVGSWTERGKLRGARLPGPPTSDSGAWPTRPPSSATGASRRALAKLGGRDPCASSSACVPRWRSSRPWPFRRRRRFVERASRSNRHPRW